ncbi:MAG: hypothetical protein IBX69_02255 [Anaerolineales bacterium]|nr:hypothetical protein [Anaerolineales bacterium]
MGVGIRINRPTPARRYNGGKDFFPSNPLVVFGYHSKTIG